MALTPKITAKSIASGFSENRPGSDIALDPFVLMVDGETFTIDDNVNTPLTFEFDDNSIVTPGNVAVQIVPTYPSMVQSGLIVAAINGAGLAVTSRLVTFNPLYGPIFPTARVTATTAANIATSDTVTNPGFTTSDYQSRIDTLDGNTFHRVLFDNLTPIFIDGTGSQDLTLILEQDGTGGWTVTWPVNVVFASGSPPTIGMSPGDVTVIPLTWDAVGLVFREKSVGGGAGGGAPANATYLTVTADAGLSAEVPVADLPAILQFARNTAATATITDILELSSKTTGTGAIGLGAGLLYTLESNSGNLYDAVRASAITTYAVDGSETSAWTLQLKASTSDVLQEVLRVDSADGALSDVKITSPDTFPLSSGHTAILVTGTYNNSTIIGSLITLDNTATVGGKFGMGLYGNLGPYFIQSVDRSLRFISHGETYAAGGDAEAYMFTPEASATRVTMGIYPHYLYPGYSTADLLSFYDNTATAIAASVTYEGLHKWSSPNQQTTVGAAGAASAPPASPELYLKVKTAAGVTLVIPAYLP